jgi:hypothetical protein
VALVTNALARKGLTTKATERWNKEMPTEAEMRPKDKYTVFARNERGYRKAIHSKLLVRLMEEEGSDDCNRNAKVDEGEPAVKSAGLLGGED